jgi:DNA-binding NtrC family response regulator
VKLLRVIEERCFQRIGGTKTIHVNFRLIAATNVDLCEAVAQKKFRDDLYYRLNVITISLPELVERKSDIPFLIQHFLERSRDNAAARSVAPEAMDLLMAYRWPGNVRELVNAVEYAVVMAKGGQIMPQDLPDSVLQKASAGSRQPQPETMSLKETEKDLIMRALRECRGNKHLAAKVLRIPRSTVQQIRHRMAA